jgi:ABC-type polysaccharide/polyol phosphate export permease
MLPSLAAYITRFNPFFYFADGIRSSMIGYSEANSALGLAITLGLVLLLGTIVTRLFQKGWKIRA